MRRFLLALIGTALAASLAEAGPLRRTSAEGPRFPRVRNAIRIMITPYPYSVPGTPAGTPPRKLLDGSSSVANTTLSILALVGPDVFTPLSWGIPPAIRTVRVVLFGSPAVGPRRDTFIWIASPMALRVVHTVRERNGLDPTGGDVLWRLAR